MALPLIAAGLALGAAALHESTKNHYRNLELNRKNDDYSNISHSSISKTPSDTYDKGRTVAPVFGSIVCCEVYNCVDHTGIWIDRDTIIELSENGLVKAVSYERFLDDRSGDNMFVACDKKHNPIVIAGIGERAIANVYTYRDYDVIENNCHRFVHFCLTESDKKITRFKSLNEALSLQAGKTIFWDRVKTPR